MSDEVSMSVSSVCEAKGKRFAYVRFTDKGKTAEFIIPEVRLNENRGFDDDDIEVLKIYIKDNMTQIKRMAAKINVFEAFKKG